MTPISDGPAQPETAQRWAIQHIGTKWYLAYRPSLGREPDRDTPFRSEEAIDAVTYRTWAEAEEERKGSMSIACFSTR